MDMPRNQTTSQVGNTVTYESDNYTIAVSKDQQQTLITDKNTGETWKAWGDPHTENNGKPSGDFKNDLSIQLYDGTKVTLQTTGMGDKGAETFTQHVIITNQDYGVAIKGVHVGDMDFVEGNGYEFDGLAADGNIIAQVGGGLHGFTGIVGNQVETIDTTAEFAAMESDDNQAASAETHADIEKLFTDCKPNGSSSPTNGAGVTNKPAHLSPQIAEDLNPLEELEELMQHMPNPMDPKVQAAAKEAARQGEELAAAAQGNDPKKTQQAQDEFQAAMNKLTKAAHEAAASEEGGSPCEGGGWYFAMAKAMGKAANKQAEKVEALANKLTSASDDDKPNISIELQAASQQMAYQMGAINNVLSTVGRAVTDMVRKN